MNIFILDDDPTKAAQAQCDKHVVKMIVESAQMLSTTHRILDGNQDRRPSSTGKTMSKYWALPDARESLLYKAVHVGHPCTVWTMESRANYVWHYIHFVALCDEYTHRYGKVHATEKLLKNILRAAPKNMPAVSGLTPFKLAMGIAPECIDNSDPVSSYRKFYQTKESLFKMAWTKREAPFWWNAA
jgi:hypothetical protein